MSAKNIIYFTFFYEPDLSAASFRNTPLVRSLSEEAPQNTKIYVFTTMPHRYSSFQVKAKAYEKLNNNTHIYRIKLPINNHSIKGQVICFIYYGFMAMKMSRKIKADIVFASSSRLLTAYLGSIVARKKKAKLYIDIRDIFVDTLDNVLNNKYFNFFLMPIIKRIEKLTYLRANHINLISQGFENYFKFYTKSNRSYYTHGVDEEFLHLTNNSQNNNKKKIITYAGNIGEGQGLDKIIPDAANLLKNDFEFHIIGDGNSKHILEAKLKSLQLSNVKIFKPMPRDQLIDFYKKSDYLFLHLNNHNAFKKVLPSKIFELAAFDKPILAGVGGFARLFLDQNVSNCYIFDPCNYQSLVKYLKEAKYELEKRNEFVANFRRDKINKDMANSILSYL